jgi:hypothetical protein
MNSTKNLLAFAFQTMQALREKTISIEDAKAQANLIKQANNLFRYELDRAIAYQKFENLEVRDIETQDSK